MRKNFLKHSSLGLLGCLLFVLGILAAIPSIVEYVQIQSLQAGQCTILTKHLLRREVTADVAPALGMFDTTSVYLPDFQFLVHTNHNHVFRAQGYALDLSLDANNYGPWDEQSHGQAIVNAYAVGRTYPCWYDSANPTQAVLTQYLNPPFFAQAVTLVPVGGILTIVAMLRWKWRQSRRAIWAPHRRGTEKR